MEQSEVMERVVKILTPWVKDEAALGKVSMETNILEDLKVNSARLVDVVIAFEDDFDIEIADDAALMALGSDWTGGPTDTLKLYTAGVTNAYKVSSSDN